MLSNHKQTLTSEHVSTNINENLVFIMESCGNFFRKFLITVLLIFVAANAVPLSAMEIECHFSNAQWQSLGVAYECWVWGVQNPGPELFEATGNHQTGRTNEDVQAFFADFGFTTPTIPSGIGALFPNLRGLDYGRNLQIITAEDLRQFPHLEEIIIFRNNLVSLDGNLFMNTLNIRGLAFNTNFIQAIGDEILDGLDQLAWADFRVNACINFIGTNNATLMELRRRIATDC